MESKDDTGPRRSVIRQGYTISCNFLEYNFPQSIFFSLWYFTRTLPNSVTLTVIFSGHERGANNVFSSLLENIGRICSLHFSALVLSKSSKKNNSTWNLRSQNSGWKVGDQKRTRSMSVDYATFDVSDLCGQRLVIRSCAQTTIQ